MIMEKIYCRICGYRLGFEPWGDDEKTPTYEICPCCGVEFGNCLLYTSPSPRD